jgi:hypothetical protein
MSDPANRAETSAELQAAVHALRPYQPSPAYEPLVELILWELRHLLPTMYPETKAGEPFAVRQEDLQQISKMVASSIDIYMRSKPQTAGEPSDI